MSDETFMGISAVVVLILSAALVGWVATSVVSGLWLTWLVVNAIYMVASGRLELEEWDDDD